jgi:hypothetical protein
VDAQRVIATLHSFRFFGLVSLVPGVVGPNLPPESATFSAYGDFATSLLAMLAHLTTRTRALFWLFVVAYSALGTLDIIVDYYNGVVLGLASVAGELGAAYAIPIIDVPLLMIMHVVAFYLRARPQPRAVRLVAGGAAASAA